MIILTHHTGEPHGILGAQAAATYLTEKLSIPSLVVGLKREFSPERLLALLREHYEGRPKVVAFSHLCGRKDIVDLMPLLRGAGYRTLLAGPQAAADYQGEVNADEHPHRFQGLKGVVDAAFHGPVDRIEREYLLEAKGCLTVPWDKEIDLDTDWSNIYLFSDELQKLDVEVVQVLRSVGCPWARRSCELVIDPPSFLKDRVTPIPVKSHGCVFCDVARDKGYQGQIDDERVLLQLRRLPEKDGRKISFELIDEYPLVPLKKLLDQAGDINLSQVNLVCRVDDINGHGHVLADILQAARARRIRIMFSSIGFESFSERILGNFNKGIRVEDTVRCVETLRRLKDQFGETLLYRRDEGANHGFIHPTPWDDAETMPEMNRNIFLYRLFDDILPEQSIPLIIHHSSFLADWIREIETRTGLLFDRDTSWIEWWKEPASR